MRNYFLQTDVPNEFVEHADPSGNKFASVSHDITSLDLPYYMLKYADVAADPNFDKRKGLPDVTTPITIPLLKVVDISTYAGDKERMLAELQFLYIMGLAIIRGTTYYILPGAIDIFYAPDGFFERFDPSALLSEKEENLKPIFKHMYDYLLPGRWWRAFYGSVGLSHAVESAVALEREMLEIETVMENGV